MDRRLKLQKRALTMESSPVSHQAAIGSDHAMTGNDDTYGILPIGQSNRARHTSNLLRLHFIRDRFAVGDVPECIPGPNLKIAPIEQNGEVKFFERASKISVQLFRSFREWTDRRVPCGVSRILRIAEMQANQRRTVRNRLKGANRTIVNGIIFHMIFSKDFHKCIAAQGRQLSAVANAWQGLLACS